MQQHTNVVTASDGDSGDSSRDHRDDGSRGVTCADQQTGDMPSGGSDSVGGAPTQLEVGGDGYGDNRPGSDSWTEESDPWSSGGGPQLGGVQQESSDEEQGDGATGGGAGSGGGHGGGLLSCTVGSSAQYTGPNSTGGHLFALQFALVAAYPPPLHFVLDFSKQPPRLDCLDWRQRVFCAWDRLR